MGRLSIYAQTCSNLFHSQAAAFKAQGMTANRGADKPSKRKTELMKKFGKPVQFLLAERIKRNDSVQKIYKDLGISIKTFLPMD